MSHPSRNGYTLIELSVTISVGSSLMMLAVGLLHQTMNLTSTARTRAAQHHTLDRLTQDFRQDVHVTTEAALTDPQHLELLRADGTAVRYQIEPARIRREERLEGAIVRREDYVLGEGLVVTFETMDQPERAAFQLRAPSANAGAGPSPTRQVAAVLGRKLAHQRAEVSP